MRLPGAYLSHLSAQFHWKSLRPYQEEVLAAVAEGSGVLAVLPTGAGKSLCFQLPAAVSRGLTLCVSPLIALMRWPPVGQRRALVWPALGHALRGRSSVG